MCSREQARCDEATRLYSRGVKRGVGKRAWTLWKQLEATMDELKALARRLRSYVLAHRRIHGSV